MKRNCILFLALILIVSIANGYGMVRKMTFEEVVWDADVIFTGKVAKMTCKPSLRSNMIFTEVLFQEVNIIHSKKPELIDGNTEMVLSYAGGELDDYGVKVSDMPFFELNGEYLLFLKMDGKDYLSPIIGGSQGQFKILTDPFSGEKYPLTMGNRGIIEIRDDIKTTARISLIKNGKLEFRNDDPFANSRFLIAPQSSDGSQSAVVSKLLENPPDRIINLEKFIEEINRILKTKPKEKESNLNNAKIFSVNQLIPEMSTLLKRKNEKSKGGYTPLENALGGSMCACGYHDLHLVMEQVPESWTPWWDINDATMWLWNQFMDIYRYVDSDGKVGDNSDNEFCGWFDDATLYDIYERHWNGALAVTMTFYWGKCGEIDQSDIIFNSAYSWTGNFLFALGNWNVINYCPVLIHEEGHTWGEQLSLGGGGCTETYDYDHPSVMHAYYHDVVEDGYGLHFPDTYLIRRHYDNQTSPLGTIDIGVESYYASNGLHNAYTTASQYNVGDTITIRGITVENNSNQAINDLRVRFFLSKDRFYSGSDTFMPLFYYWNTFPSEAYYVGDFSNIIPNVSAGTYYVGIMVTKNGYELDNLTSNNTTTLYQTIIVKVPTPTPTSTHAPTATPTPHYTLPPWTIRPFPIAPISAAGYMNTRLQHQVPGNLQLLAITAYKHVDVKIQIYYHGQPTRIFLETEPYPEGVYGLYVPGINFPNKGNDLIELMPQYTFWLTKKNPWPFLVVEE